MSTAERLAEAMERLLTWPNPQGTIEQEYIPRWLAEECRSALAAYRTTADGGGQGVTPLTEDERRKLWRESHFRGNGGQIDWFIEGTMAAERHHRIGTPASTGGEGHA